MSWTFVYAGREALTGIPDQTRKAMQAKINEVLKAGETAWLSGSAPGGSAGAEFLVGPGIPVYFDSEA